MKTLNDMIKEMQAQHNFWATEKWMRLACEAMADEIVQDKHYGCTHDTDMANAWTRGYNDCRDELIKNIERFMGEKE